MGMAGESCADLGGAIGTRDRGLSRHANALDGFVSPPKGIGDHPEVNERREVTVTFRHFRTGGGVADDCYLEARLEQFAHVTFDAKVCRHARENNLVDAYLEESKVAVGTMRASDRRASKFTTALIQDGLIAMEDKVQKDGENGSVW